MAIKEDLVPVVAENAEALLDGLTDNELVKGIPIINTVVGLVKTGKGVSDYLFAKKINTLLVSLNEAKPEDKQKVKEFAQNDKNSAKLAEHILNLVNKMTDKGKAEIIANVFLGYLNEEINESNFRRALDIIDSIFIDDLLDFLNENLRARYTKLHFKKKLPISLVNTPLLEERKKAPTRPMSDQNEWDLTQELLKNEISYKPTMIGKQLHRAYNYGKESREIK